MRELPEKSKFSLQMAIEEGIFYPVLEEPIDFNFHLYHLASGAPKLTSEFYKKFAHIFGERVNKLPSEILRKLKHEYFFSAIQDSGNFEEDFPYIDRYDYLEWMNRQIDMIDKTSNKITHMNDTRNSNAKKYIELMKKAIHDDFGEYVKEFDAQRPIISHMNKIVEGVISDCQSGKIKLPYRAAEDLENFTEIYQLACRASELYHYKQKLNAGLVFIKDRAFLVPPKRNHYS